MRHPVDSGYISTCSRVSDSQTQRGTFGGTQDLRRSDRSTKGESVSLLRNQPIIFS